MRSPRRGSYPQVDPRASGLMTRALATAPARLGLEEAARLARHRRARLVLARRGGGWAGATPETLERARGLGLGAAPLASVLWGAAVLPADAPEVRVRKALGPSRPFVLVAGPRGPEGAVFRAPEAPGSLPVDLADRLARLPARLGQILRRVAVLAEARGGEAALVGGAVRDILRGRPAGERLDLDLAVVGDARRVARRLAAELGVAVREHPAFMTATVELPDGSRIDLATARRERYPAAGALPEVEPAPLAADLWRRDFSVNALAARLRPEAWGQLLDPTGGLVDLRAGRIRVLHPLSFLEDPTRLFRAVRFALRLGARLDPTTRRLFVEAGRLGVFPALSGDRIRAELRLARAEADPPSILVGLGRLGAFRLVHPGYRFGRAAEALVRRVGARTRGLGLPDETRETLDALALTAHLGPAAVAAWAGRLGLPAEPLLRARGEATRLLEALRPAASAGAAWAALRRVPAATAAWALVSARDRGVRGRLIEHLGTSGDGPPPLLDGHDVLALGVAPGPEIARLLEGATRAQLDGRVRTRDEALEWVRGAAARSSTREADPRRPPSA